MKKSIIWLILFLIVGGGILKGTVAEAAVSHSKTSDVVITFYGDEEEDDQKSMVYPSSKNQKPSGRLPSTGELISSIIWLLVGFSILIVFVGIFSLKNIMLKVAWE